MARGIKAGMGGSTSRSERWDRTAVLKKESKKRRRRDDKRAANSK